MPPPIPERPAKTPSPKLPQEVKYDDVNAKNNIIKFFILYIEKLIISLLSDMSLLYID